MQKKLIALFMVCLIVVIYAIAMSMVRNINAQINPESPDYPGTVQKRMDKFQEDIMGRASNILEMQEGMRKIENEWDKELNIVYKKLMSIMTPKEKTSLITSQKSWLKYRDDEFKFLSQFYTQEKLGSSYLIDYGHARISLIKSRVIELNTHLEYAR